MCEIWIMCILVLVLFAMTVSIWIKIVNCNYCKHEDYNYDEENPNALITGQNIAGTVYASDPDNAPGLGWIL